MTYETYNKLSKDVKKKLLNEKILELRNLWDVTLGANPTYDQLAAVQKWALSHFDYTPDGYQFNKEDMWDPLAFEKMLLVDKLKDDCDGFGYAILGIMYHVFGMKKQDIYRVSCATETNEGHFVAWVRSKSGIVYQLENRVRKPRTIKYMRELGYEYWHYSPMTNVGQWFNAKKKAAEFVYDTPIKAAGNEPELNVGTMIKATPKSKTLMFGWLDKLITTSIGTLGALATQADWKVVAAIGGYAVVTLVVIYIIRAMTNEPLEFK